jgi:hypothetical protein
VGAQQPRHCPRCGPVAWYRDRPPGARCSVARCLVCGGRVTRIKRGKLKPKLPPGLETHKQLVKQADDLWRHLIYRKAPRNGDLFQCLCGCGRWYPGIQAAHGIPREEKKGGLRWDLDNGLPWWDGCHRRLEKDREGTRDAFVAQIGAIRWQRLEWLKRYGCKITSSDLRLIIIDLQRRLENAGA